MLAKNSPLHYVSYAQIPQLHVGGYYDQEDLNGPQLMYRHMEKKDRDNYNHIVLGPWNHGQWARGKGDSLGKISFGSSTSYWFQALQKNDSISGSKGSETETLKKPIVFKPDQINGKLISHGLQKAP
ncbi:MAG: hypothetical protein IPO42_10905 [Chitinophagaceae bacterium]|nr:hypothetical protein [Chitinophagaceae bacterium]